MPRRITQSQWAIYYDLRRAGYSRALCAKEAQISESAAKRNELGQNPTSLGHLVKKARDMVDDLPDIPGYDKLNEHARKAFDDFGYFRRRYFGRVASPWQEEAAYRIVEWLASDRKEFVVINCPPGSGKTTLFCHDIVAWLIVRNRAVRCLIGSRTQDQANMHVDRLRDSFTRRDPVLNNSEQVARGLEFDAEATLTDDFGVFKTRAGAWTTKFFTVAQHGGRPVSEKERTVNGYGRDGGVLGGRYDFVIWDDLVDDKNVYTIDAMEGLRRFWTKTAETRLEPRGLLILQGQRLGGDDLYRYALDMRGGYHTDADADEPAADDASRKYQHVVYRAHYEELCTGEHQNAKPYPQGCLLDPVRLPWRELRATMENDSEQYLVVYQQEDTDPATVLVQKVWVHGGRGLDGLDYLGCWDEDRSCGVVPAGLTGPRFSVVCADPSPTKFWAAAWWLFHPSSEQRFLLDLHRRVMRAPDFLDWNHNEGVFTGLLESWWLRSRDQGAVITHVIVEQNAAQRFLLQYDHVHRWMRLRKVQIIPHDTHRNKSDATYGVQTLGGVYKHGRVRLPGNRFDGSRTTVMQQVDEVTKWPKGRTDDCVMQQWFLEWNLPRIYTPKLEQPIRLWRPSWAKASA